MKKIIAIALIAIMAVSAAFATGNTVQVKATKAITELELTLYGKESTGSDWSSSEVEIASMGSAFTVNFKVEKAISNYTGNQADTSFTVTVGALKLDSLDSGWVEGQTMVTPAIESIVGGSNSSGTITVSNFEIKGYKAASTPLTFNAKYTIPSTLQAGDYVSEVTLTYTAP